MWHRRIRHRAAGDIVSAAEAILAGRAADAYRDQGFAVPPWALANTLAHAPTYELRALANAGPRFHPGSVEAALGRLAGCLLDVGPRPEDVVAVQHELLVQVELIILGQGDNSPGVAIAEIEAMIGALLSHRKDRSELPDDE